jgi:hypothetical protein
MNRLTDDKTAECLKENIEKLKEKGFDVDMSNLRYVKLAEYERLDEEIENLGLRITLESSKFIKDVVNEALESYLYKGRTIREWADIITKRGEG